MVGGITWASITLVFATSNGVVNAAAMAPVQTLDNNGRKHSLYLHLHHKWLLAMGRPVCPDSKPTNAALVNAYSDVMWYILNYFLTPWNPPILEIVLRKKESITRKEWHTTKVIQLYSPPDWYGYSNLDTVLLLPRDADNNGEYVLSDSTCVSNVCLRILNGVRCIFACALCFTISKGTLTTAVTYTSLTKGFLAFYHRTNHFTNSSCCHEYKWCCHTGGELTFQ